MLNRLNHPAAARHMHDAKKRGDPTGTMPIRRRYMRELDRRWALVGRTVQQVIVGQDLLGLQQVSPSSIVFGLQNFTPMAGVPNAGKVRGFQRWFDDLLGNTILQQDAPYLRPALGQAYSRAVTRATRLARLETVPPKVLQEVEANLDTLQQFAVIELQGIMEAVSQKAVRAATEGLLQGQRTQQVSRSIRDTIQDTGVVRSRSLIQTIIVRAHSEGTLDTFEAAGITHVGLIPEFLFTRRLGDARREGPGSRTRNPSASTVARIRRAERRTARLREVEVLTAGDLEVCPVCEEISDRGPYDIDTARGLIPAHPNCRCSFIPVGDARFASAKEEDDD